jgi:hypothetical protein
MGRPMTWLNSGPGKCLDLAKLEIFNVELGDNLNIQGRFE